MSADTTPIAPARFASAIKDLSLGMLHLKVLEIRNSIAHLQYSNDQLKPFADGTSAALGEPSAAPDQDCIDAIRENEAVIDRMAERLAIVRAEVEDRGFSWTEFQSQDEVEAGTGAEGGEPSASQATTNGQVNGQVASQPAETRHSAWTDGTFQTGTISNGQMQFDSQPAGQTASTNQGEAQATTRGGESQDNQDSLTEDGLHL